MYQPKIRHKKLQNLGTNESVVNGSDSDDSDDEIFVITSDNHSNNFTSNEQDSSKENRDIVKIIPGNITSDEFSTAENNENVNECPNLPDSLPRETQSPLEWESSIVQSPLESESPIVQSPPIRQRPQRQTRPPEYLQYQSLGSPGSWSFPIVLSISTPMYFLPYNVQMIYQPMTTAYY